MADARDDTGGLPPRPRVGVVGAGAVGSYYGGLLFGAGQDVHFLFRRDYETVAANGLRVIHPNEGTAVTHRVPAYRDPAAIGPCDLVIVAAKSTANPELPPVVAPLVGDGTALLVLQNGLGNVEFFDRAFGAGRTMGGLCFICLNRTAPGVVESYIEGSLSLGEGTGPPLPRTRQLAAAFEAAGMKTRLAERLGDALWRKLCWNIPFNGLAIAGGGLTTDQVLADPALTARARALMAEVIAAAGASGFAIKPEFAQKQIDLTTPMGAYRPSSLIDFLEGREVEVEAIFGEPLRRGRAAGVPMPELEALYGEIRAAVDARPGSTGYGGLPPAFPSP